MTIVDESKGSVDERVDERVDDCISRQAVLDALDKSKYSNEFCEEHHIDWSINLGMAHIVVNELKPVTPAEKVGRWIEKDGYDGDTYYDCSECGESWTTIDGTPWNNGMKYCPNCGAKMREVEE